MKRPLAVWPWLLAAALPAQADLRDGPRLSPFRGMRAVADGLEVQVDGDTWYALESVGGVDTAELLRASRRLAGAAWWKRVSEDLPALLAALGQEPGLHVDLRLRDLATGDVVDRPGVPMTAANRRRLLQQNRAAAGAPAPEPAPPPARLTAADARADLQALRTLLDTRFAYRTLRPVDLDALLSQAGAAIGDDGIDAAAFARAVDRVVRAFGDGHSRVDGVEPESPTSLPFLVQQVAGGAVAFHADRRGFVDDDCPFLVAIDGVPVERWLAAAAARATAGSPAMQARAAERGLRQLGVLRLDLGLPAAATVRVRLRGPGGERERELAVADRPMAFGIWPRGATRRLDGDLGYLRLEQMRGDAGFLDGIDAAMQSFRGTRGLVVDVRGNGGGTRDALRRLMPYLLPANGGPVVGNVAVVLQQPGRPPDPEALADRGMFAADWPGWTDARRSAITAFARGFQPSWRPPAGRFSPWHFLVLDRADNPAAYAYERPVVVLIDRGCFSATDVFAAALGTLPQVTLVGEPTAGGSGRARDHRLPRSGLRLWLSTMASFRPDGVLFEGRGVEPDVVVTPQPGDLVGASDTALATAVERLR